MEMELTMLLAKIMGIYMLLGGVSVLLYPTRYNKAIKEATKSYILPYFDGALALIIGLLIVLHHNLWGALTEGLITAIGWMAVIEGLAMFLLPQESFAGMMKKFNSDKWRMGMGIIAILIGAYLAYMGFFA